MSGVSQLRPIDTSSRSSEEAHSHSKDLRVKSSAERLKGQFELSHTPVPSSSSLSSVKMIRQKKGWDQTKETIKQVKKKEFKRTPSDDSTASTVNLETE